MSNGNQRLWIFEWCRYLHTCEPTCFLGFICKISPFHFLKCIQFIRFARFYSFFSGCALFRFIVNKHDIVAHTNRGTHIIQAHANNIIKIFLKRYCSNNYFLWFYCRSLSTSFRWLRRCSHFVFLCNFFYEFSAYLH